MLRISTAGIAQSWGTLKTDLESLAECMDSYASYLETQNEKQKYRQSLSEPVRQFGEHAVVQTVHACSGPVKPCYSILDQVLKETEEYSPVYFDETLHIKEPFNDCIQRHRFIKDMALSFEIDILTYCQGASLTQTVFVWRVPSGVICLTEI